MLTAKLEAQMLSAPAPSLADPPYAYISEPPYGSKSEVDEVVGVGADMIKAMGKMCGFDVTVIQAHWGDCWGAGEIGQGLLQGWCAMAPLSSALCTTLICAPPT